MDVLFNIRTIAAPDSPETHACKQLWAAVITQAMEDADLMRDGRGCKRKGVKWVAIRTDAIDFLTTNRSDYAFEAAGVDSISARKAIQAKLA